MSTGEQQNNPSPSAIRDEVRRTVQQLNEMASTEKDFDQFCDTVLSRVVKITGAHGALLWQVNGSQTPQLTHQTGRHPNANAKDVLSQENSQHSNAVMEVVAKEREIYAAQAADSGKPAEIVEKMIDGRIRKFLAENSLTEQAFVKDPDQTVGKLVSTAGATVLSFTRFEVGEGIDVEKVDFAAEVAAQLGNG